MNLKIRGRGICVKNQTEERGLLGRIFLRTPETPLNVLHCFLSYKQYQISVKTNAE